MKLTSKSRALKFLRSKLFLIFILAALCLLLVLTLYAQDMAMVFDVTDGDTIVVDINGKKESINLIGIDAPESVMNKKAEIDSRMAGESLLEITSKGIDAKRFVEKLIKKGDFVAITYDVQMRDQEGKLQGYVYLPDGRMLNEEIVRAGFAKVAMTPPNTKYQERFNKAYKEAKAYRRGLLKSP